jgi:hypothetical protein
LTRSQQATERAAGFCLGLSCHRVVEAEGEGVVRERGVDVHDAVDDERRALVAVEQAGGERPGRLELLDVALVDLGQIAVIVRVVVLTGHHPVLVALRFLDELVVGLRHARHGDRRERHDRQCRDGIPEPDHPASPRRTATPFGLAVIVVFIRWRHVFRRQIRFQHRDIPAISSIR